MTRLEIKQFVSGLLLFMETGDYALAAISLWGLHKLNSDSWFQVKDEFLKQAQTWGLLGSASTIVKASAGDDLSAYTKLIPGLSHLVQSLRSQNEDPKRSTTIEEAIDFS